MGPNALYDFTKGASISTIWLQNFVTRNVDEVWPLRTSCRGWQVKEAHKKPSLRKSMKVLPLLRFPLAGQKIPFSMLFPHFIVLSSLIDPCNRRLVCIDMSVEEVQCRASSLGGGAPTWGRDIFALTWSFHSSADVIEERLRSRYAVERCT